jgi:glycerol-3-phosphate dehydrogenase
VRPLIAQPGKKANEVSRKDEIWTSPGGLVSIAGGKLSAYRAMAERVVDLVVERTGAAARACATADVPLPGGEAAPDLAGIARSPPSG